MLLVVAEVVDIIHGRYIISHRHQCGNNIDSIKIATTLIAFGLTMILCPSIIHNGLTIAH